MQSESQQHIANLAPFLYFPINHSPSLLSSTKPIQHSTTVHTYEPHSGKNERRHLIFHPLHRPPLHCCDYIHRCRDRHSGLFGVDSGAHTHHHYSRDFGGDIGYRHYH
jgi:hypothetical protein